MPSTASPFGMRPYSNSGGSFDPIALQGVLPDSVGIAKGSPVKMNNGVLALAAAGDAIAYVFAGCEYDDVTAGRRVLANRWPGTTGTTNEVAYLWPVTEGRRFVIQSAAAIAQDDIGEVGDLTANSSTENDASTGISEVTLATVAASGSAQLMVQGIELTPDNAWGDTYCNVIVTVAEPQLGITALSAGV